MPLVFQQNINEHTLLGLWRLEESSSFFGAVQNNIKSISHKEKKRQHLAGRYLLNLLNPELNTEEIRYTDTGKPYMANGSCFFSISHTEGWVAAAVSSIDKVAVDVERFSKKAHKLRFRFLSDHEQQILAYTEEDFDLLCTLAWSVKETLYKYYSEGDVDFISDLKIETITKNPNGYILECVIEKQPIVHLKVQAIMDKAFVLTYTL